MVKCTFTNVFVLKACMQLACKGVLNVYAAQGELLRKMRSLKTSLERDVHCKKVFEGRSLKRFLKKVLLETCSG